VNSSVTSGRSSGTQSGRQLGAGALAQALKRTRERTLGLIDAWSMARPDLAVPCEPELNLPLWELGHIGWFQEWWIGRNDQRPLGADCDPVHPRRPSRLPGADALYDSSAVAHDLRWTLELPDMQATRRYLEAVLNESLTLLNDAGSSDRALYFWRLVLFHEQMHNEAMAYMARSQGIPLPEGLVHHRQGAPAEAREPAAARDRPAAGTAGAPITDTAQLEVQAQHWTLGNPPTGFAFDNEIGPHSVELAAFQIDARPVSWQQYLGFVQQTGHRLPPHVRPESGRWQHFDGMRWDALDLESPAVHVSWDDAQAWCAWAGRRLPTEAQWECAAQTRPAMQWGTVWEWTDSVFESFPGFVAHPYRDYSAPWFGSRKVLRGACMATAAEMVDVRYRNFFPAHRRDIFAGFRTVGPA
jgi:EgtB-related family protein